MAQYQDGTVTVTNGSNAVVGLSTLWLANVTIGDLFFATGDTAGYEVATIPTDTSLTLTTLYAGVTRGGNGYSITRDFTPNFDFPYIVTGDRNTALVLKRFALDVDALLATYQPTVVQAGDGTVGAPAYSFLLDTDTGMYRIGANHIGWAVNGVLAFDIDSTGATFANDVLTGSGAFRTDFSLNAQYQASSNVDGEKVGYLMTVVGGTNNTRAGMWLDDATQEVTHDIFYSTGVGSYVWNISSTTKLTLDANRAAFDVDVSVAGTAAIWTSGTGTPEAVVTASVGSLFTRTDGGTSTTLYVKESGVGNTGWVAK